MKFDLLKDLNETAGSKIPNSIIFEQAIDFLGFDRKEVICTEEDLNLFLSKMVVEGIDADSERLLKQSKPISENRLRDEEDKWADQLSRTGSQHKAQEQQKKRVANTVTGKTEFSLKPKEDAVPKEGDFVILPNGKAGKIEMTDGEGRELKVLIASRYLKKDTVVHASRLIGKPLENGSQAWMIRK